MTDVSTPKNMKISVNGSEFNIPLAPLTPNEDRTMNEHEARESIGSIAPFGLRLMPELKKKIERAAADNSRSMNSEITERLNRSFKQEGILTRDTDPGLPLPPLPRYQDRGNPWEFSGLGRLGADFKSLSFVDMMKFCDFIVEIAPGIAYSGVEEKPNTGDVGAEIIAFFDRLKGEKAK